MVGAKSAGAISHKTRVDMGKGGGTDVHDMAPQRLDT